MHAHRVVRLALVLSVLAGPDPRDPVSRDLDPAPLRAPIELDEAPRIGWIGDVGGHHQRLGSQLLALPGHRF